MNDNIKFYQDRVDEHNKLMTEAFSDGDDKTANFHAQEAINCEAIVKRLNEEKRVYDMEKSAIPISDHPLRDEIRKKLTSGELVIS